LKNDNNKTRIALYSVIAGVILTGIKGFVGFATGSLGILSEAAHSLLDLGAAFITYFSVRISDKPPDSSHQYGHGKVENLSALVECILLLITCIWIVSEAVERLSGKEVHVDASIAAFAVMGISLFIDVIISRILHKGAKEHSSQALEADALHYSSDILSSGVVIAGLIGVKFGYEMLDPIAALGVAVLVTAACLKLGKRTIDALLDRAPSGLSEKITAHVSGLPDVDKVESIRIRSSGSSTFVDMVVSTGRLLSIDQGHSISDSIESEVRKIIPQSDVLVHFHPSQKGETFMDKIHAVAGNFKEIEEIHNVHSYQNSENGKYFVSLHIKLTPCISLDEAHNLVDRLEEEIKKELPVIGEITTHIETTKSIGDGERKDVSAEKLEIIRTEVLKDKRVKGIHDCYFHKTSTGSILSCHILIDNNLLLEEAHEVATIAENQIRGYFPEAEEVVVHTEPV
jgi:cation diffusion facilitator family transporter